MPVKRWMAKENKQLVEPEVWIEFHRQPNYGEANGDQYFKYCEGPRVWPLWVYRMRLDKSTNQWVWEYLM